MKLTEYFNLKNSKEVMQWESYTLFSAEMDFKWELFFDFTSDFKFCFSNRENTTYLGLGHLSFNNFQETLDTLPADIFYFYQQTFYKDKTSIVLPEIQIIKTKEKTHVYFFQKNDSENEIQSYTELYNRNILMQETHEPDEHGWRDIFRKARIYLAQNKKIVLSRKTQFRFKNRVIIQKLFLNLFKKGFYNYLVQTRYHYFVGSSPERLLKFAGNTFHTEALAGTRSLDKKDELLNSVKDQEEQKIVLDEILKSIKEFSSDIKTSDTFLYEYKNMAHLKTTVEAKPQTTNIFDWINSLHPTPAVCGLPRAKAFEFLKTYEPYKRENYCSSLGIIQRNQMDICVAIRCAEVYRNLVTAYTGVGVVNDSNLELEWQELDLKLDNIRTALEI